MWPLIGSFSRPFQWLRYWYPIIRRCLRACIISLPGYQNDVLKLSVLFSTISVLGPFYLYWKLTKSLNNVLWLENNHSYEKYVHLYVLFSNQKLDGSFWVRNQAQKTASYIVVSGCGFLYSSIGCEFQLQPFLNFCQLTFDMLSVVTEIPSVLLEVNKKFLHTFTSMKKKNPFLKKKCVCMSSFCQKL